MPQAPTRPPIAGESAPNPGAIADAIGPLSGRNLVASGFYDGPGWRRFRPFERAFLAAVGGEQRARGEILRHLGDLGPGARVLEVGIGDGDNLRHLPEGWEVYGVDLARSRLEACLARFPSMAGRLAWAEAEALPYPDAHFAASFTVGGFNYFGDHARALAEMRRVTQPGGPVIVADEVTWLPRLAIGRVFGARKVDEWWLKALGATPEFARMVVRDPVDLTGVFPDGAQTFAIWRGLGYCVVDQGPPP